MQCHDCMQGLTSAALSAGLHDQFVSFHSVFLSMFFGPLGLLSHLITQARVLCLIQDPLVAIDCTEGTDLWMSPSQQWRQELQLQPGVQTCLHFLG